MGPDPDRVNEFPQILTSAARHSIKCELAPCRHLALARVYVAGQIRAYCWDHVPPWDKPKVRLMLLGQENEHG